MCKDWVYVLNNKNTPMVIMEHGHKLIILSPFVTLMLNEHCCQWCQYPKVLFIICCVLCSKLMSTVCGTETGRQNTDWLLSCLFLLCDRLLDQSYPILSILIKNCQQLLICFHHNILSDTLSRSFYRPALTWVQLSMKHPYNICQTLQTVSTSPSAAVSHLPSVLSFKSYQFYLLVVIK